MGGTRKGGGKTLPSGGRTYSNSKEGEVILRRKWKQRAEFGEENGKNWKGNRQSKKRNAHSQLAEKEGTLTGRGKGFCKGRGYNF